MWEEILRLAVGNGLWAVLFCLLLVYQLRDSRRREGKYQETIDALSDRLGTVNEVRRTADETLRLVRSGRKPEKNDRNGRTEKEESDAA